MTRCRRRTGRPSVVVMNDELLDTELDEARFAQGGHDGFEVLIEQSDQLVVSDVRCCHDEEAPGPRLQEVAGSEVTILGDHHSVLGIGQPRDFRVGGPVGVRQLGRVDDVMAMPPSGSAPVVVAAARRRGNSPGEGHHAPHPRRQRPELKCCEQIVSFKVRIVAEDLLDRHARGQQVEESLDRVAQSTDRRLAMTDRWVGGDAIESRHRSQAYPGARRSDGWAT
jgi:hypothetical protein